MRVAGCRLRDAGLVIAAPRPRIPVNEPLLWDLTFRQARRRDREPERDAPGGLEVHDVEYMIAGAQRDLSGLFGCIVLSVVIDDELTVDPQLAAVVAGQVEGIKSISGHAQVSAQVHTVLFRRFVAA